MDVKNTMTGQITIKTLSMICWKRWCKTTTRSLTIAKIYLCSVVWSMLIRGITSISRQNSQLSKNCVNALDHYRQYAHLENQLENFAEELLQQVVEKFV